LPGEIRNQIFDNLLDITDLISIDKRALSTYTGCRWRNFEIHLSEVIALTMVCRQLRKETQGRLFQNSKLLTRRSSDALATMPANISALITELSVDLGSCFANLGHAEESYWNKWAELAQLPNLEKVVVVWRSGYCEQPLVRITVMRRRAVSQKGHLGKPGAIPTAGWDIGEENFDDDYYDWAELVLTRF
jgi:hypothetical protein